MPEWRDLLFAEGGTNCYREVAGGIQHEETAQCTRLQAACPRGLYPLERKSIFTAHGCDIKTLTSLGLNPRARHDSQPSVNRIGRFPGDWIAKVGLKQD